MTTGRYRRRNPDLRQTGARRNDRESNAFFAMVGFSVLAHVIIAAILSQSSPPPMLHKSPAIYVDLLMPPVANPRRGSGSVAKAVVTPVATEQKTIEPVKVAKEAVTPAKTAMKAPVVKAINMDQVIAKIRQKKALEDIINTIKDMKESKKSPTTQPLAVAGSPSGSGDEVGSAIGEWLQQAVKEKWSWPDTKRKDLSAEVDVEFDIRGKLSKCEIRKPSSDPRFDASLKRAILSIESLPMVMRKTYKETILFNLEDLQGQ